MLINSTLEMGKYRSVVCLEFDAVTRFAGGCGLFGSHGACPYILALLTVSLRHVEALLYASDGEVEEMNRSWPVQSVKSGLRPRRPKL
jgi:hypothetical protein